MSADIYLVALGRQLVKVVLNFRANRLSGKEEDLFVLDRVQNLVRNVPSVRRLFEVVQPLLGQPSLLLVLGAVERLRGLYD